MNICRIATVVALESRQPLAPASSKVRRRSSLCDFAHGWRVMHADEPEGHWSITSPGKAKVHRSKGDLSVLCHKDGFQDATATVRRISTERLPAISSWEV